MPYFEDVSQEDDKTGNQRARPRSDKTSNPIYNNLIDHLGFVETTYADSSYYEDSQKKPYNPDDIVDKRSDYSIYEDMVKDDQVSVCLQLKRDLVLSNGFDILVDSQDPSDLSVKEELEKSLKEYPEIPLMDSLEEVLSAFDFGFSISEKVFEIKPDGYACLKFLKTRHPTTWLLHTDTQGNVQRYEQRGPQGSIDIDKENLIHYKINHRFGNPYGKSDLRAAWEAWFVKKEIIKFYSIFLEKAASPTPVAKYDKNLPQQAVDDIFNAIKKLQTKTALAIPKDIELEFLETSNQGDVYVKGINLFNMFIGRSLLVPDLLGFQGSETSGGSYSLGKEQMNVFFRHINRRRSQLEDIVNKCIIKPLVYYNYGELENCPRFKLRPLNDEEAIDLARLWLEAVKGHVYKPSEEEINHFRSLSKFPEGEVEFEDEEQEVTKVEGEMEFEEPKNQGEEGEEDAEESKIKEALQETQEVKKQEYALAEDAPSSLVGGYDRKVNYALIDSQLKRLNESVVTEADPVIDNIYEDLLSQIRKKKIIPKQSIEKFDSIKLKFTSKLKLLLKKYFLQAHTEAKQVAQSELLKGNRFAAPLPDEEFLKFLDQETLNYLGDFEYNILKDARIKIIEAIKDGKPLTEIEGILRNDGSELSKTSLERYARTKFTEVVNRARLEFFDKTGIVAAYQFSAVLDDRTSDICEGLHGKIFEKGDEPIPPLHFNCRSLLIPITKYETYEADDKVGDVPIDKFIEENKGEGFPVK